MPVRKFCKIVSVAILVFLWFPAVWASVSIVLTLSDFVRAMEDTFGQIEDPSPAPASFWFTYLSALAYLVALPVLCIWLFFPKNPLEMLFLWLAEDRNEVSLMTVIIRTDPTGESSPPQLPPDPPQADPEASKGSDQYRHPHEDYLPPQYRSKGSQ